MVKDRLAELQAKHAEFCQADEKTEIDKSVAHFSNLEIQLDLCLHKVTQISKKIRAVNNDVEQMKALQKDILSNPLEDHKEVIRLEKTSDQIFNAASTVQKEITQYRQEVVEMLMHKSHEKLIKNHLNKLEVDLTKARNNFRAAQVEYIEKTQKLHQREYNIMTGHDDHDDPDDPDKIHTPLPAEFLGNYFVEAERIKMELREIKARDTQIKKIEESVTEVNQLFKEVNALLMEQGEKLDTIEKCVENSVNYVQEANIQLKQASKYQDTARRRKICCIGFLVAILATVGIVIAIVIMLQNDESEM
ncbi:syntaxin-1A-like [Mercenaria mercenaria]|uniref:syntaxin-1A-like n=1 Tax=Mercenaria mercenaria TaxID=6596 RepID=UPI00234F358C|nr:syntaxin-1A-like [Mercenaria mercenaria]XP_045173691.2 syntaxin-1A-like [Mercenaria mercenaria]